MTRFVTQIMLKFIVFQYFVWKILEKFQKFIQIFVSLSQHDTVLKIQFELNFKLCRYMYNFFN